MHLVDLLKFVTRHGDSKQRLQTLTQVLLPINLSGLTIMFIYII